MYRVQVQMFKLRLGKSVSDPPSEGRVYFEEVKESEPSDKTVLPTWADRMEFQVTSVSRWIEVTLVRAAKFSSKVVGKAVVSLSSALSSHSDNGVVAEYPNLSLGDEEGTEAGSIHLTLKYTCYYEKQRKALLGARPGSYDTETFSFECGSDIALQGHNTVLNAASKWMSAMGSSVDPISVDSVTLPSHATKDAILIRATVAYKVLPATQDSIARELAASRPLPVSGKKRPRLPSTSLSASPSIPPATASSSSSSSSSSASTSTSSALSSSTTTPSSLPPPPPAPSSSQPSPPKRHKNLN